MDNAPEDCVGPGIVGSGDVGLGDIGSVGHDALGDDIVKHVYSELVLLNPLKLLY